METTTTRRTRAVDTALPEFMSEPSQDLEFARRSVRYMVDNWCDAADIIDALTVDLGLTTDAAHALLRDTPSLVAA